MLLINNLILQLCGLVISSFSSGDDLINKQIKTNMEAQKYGIEGMNAPELSSDIYWVDGQGKVREPVKLSDAEGKFKVIYGFQSWCPGCHSQGLPSLQKMVDALKDNKSVEFYAVQTVFEGEHANTKEKMLEVQK